MFILARTFLKTHNICCYYRDNIFFLLLCPFRDYCFFWDNMIKYTEHIISEPEDSKSFFFLLNHDTTRAWEREIYTTFIRDFHEYNRSIVHINRDI